jgi:Domain of unknown function (DUF4388)
MSDDRAGPRVGAVLEGLALQNASGELQIDGRPGGAIYLDQGEITFARSAWSPDLGTRLRASIGSAPGLRDLLAEPDDPGSEVGRELVRRGYLTAEALSAILRSVVLDAVIVLTVPLSSDASIDGIRLVTGESHWAAEFCRLSTATVRAEALSRSGRLAGFDLSQAARLELTDLSSGFAVITQEQWALACKMDGTISARELAWDNGLALYETLECVTGLLRAGLCRAVAVAGPRPKEQQAAPAGPAGSQAKVISGLAPGRVTARGITTRARLPRAASGTGPGSAVRQMPRRRPGNAPESVPGSGPGAERQENAERQAGAEQQAEDDFTPVSLDSLRRVLDGLRRLN